MVSPDSHDAFFNVFLALTKAQYSFDVFFAVSMMRFGTFWNWGSRQEDAGSASPCESSSWGSLAKESR